MAGFSTRLKTIGLDEAVQGKIEQIIAEAGNEFPCLSCPSKKECNSFKWFMKWFETSK
jgi:hypothetical protein